MHIGCQPCRIPIRLCQCLQNFFILLYVIFRALIDIVQFSLQQSIPRLHFHKQIQQTANHRQQHRNDTPAQFYLRIPFFVDDDQYDPQPKQDITTKEYRKILRQILHCRSDHRDLNQKQYHNDHRTPKYDLQCLLFPFLKHSAVFYFIH